MWTGRLQGTVGLAAPWGQDRGSSSQEQGSQGAPGQLQLRASETSLGMGQGQDMGPGWA